jgi:tetratricopeptide (TPR) repeat protein
MSLLLYNNLGVTYDYKGEYDKAIEYYTKDLVISLKTFGGEHPGVAGSYNNLGVAYRAKGEYDKAIEYHREAITILEKSGDRFGHVNSYLHLRNVYQKQNNEDKRIYSLKMATDIILKYRTQMGKDKEYFTQKFIPIFEELIQIYNDRGEYEKAFEISEKMRGAFDDGRDKSKVCAKVH